MLVLSGATQSKQLILIIVVSWYVLLNLLWRRFFWKGTPHKVVFRCAPRHAPSTFVSTMNLTLSRPQSKRACVKYACVVMLSMTDIGQCQVGCGRPGMLKRIAHYTQSWPIYLKTTDEQNRRGNRTLPMGENPKLTGFIKTTNSQQLRIAENSCSA